VRGTLLQGRVVDLPFVRGSLHSGS
jgi:hypothetical protein